MYGVVAVGAIFLYNRYTKKSTPQEEENQGGGGKGGGGGFFPMPIIPPIAPIIPIVTPLKGQVVVPTTPTNPIVVSGLGGAKPVVAVSSSSTGVGNSGIGVPNSGFAFKPFDGDVNSMRLENLVRSINRP